MTKPPADTEAIFLAALDVTPPERSRYLEAACAGNPELLRRVRELLQAHEDSQGPLDAPPLGLEGTGDLPTRRDEPGMVIGPYKLLERLGEGGMGVVFLADQEKPVRRQVALKIIKAGMDSARILARFEQERQALALMDHANIAKVLDAGTTPGEPGGVSPGRPYFVMERVKGIPITKFCDQERLTIRERLELFIPVCQAVQHAHQKGIIHRDLKPSNVLVGLYDGKPVPKVIDFGVAKAINQRLTEHTLFTEVGCLVGTLEYMAPEQAEVNSLDIDTRADIYSLGVLLYELLTGSPPFTSRQLRGVGYNEMLRLIREVEPPRPSVRLSASQELPGIAARRKVEPRRLARLVHGDLDWIVMTCLAKERARRYETANGLASDLGRYLRDEPVLAGPPSPLYRLQKFVRRHRGGVLAASIIFLSLVGGMLGTTWGLLAERRARESAQKRLGQVEKANDILGSMFRDLDPNAEEKDGKSLRVVLGERLDKAVEQLDAEAIGDPLAVARMQAILGQSLYGLGYYGKAGRVLEKAQTVQEAMLGADHPDTLTTLDTLAQAYRVAGRTNEAIALFERVRDARVKRPGPDHADTLATLNNLALAYGDNRQMTQAIALFEQVRDACMRTRGANDPHTLTALHNLALAYRAAKRRTEAIALFEQVRDARVKLLRADHPSTLATLHGLALTYREDGRTAEAIAVFEQVRDACIRTLGPDHPHTLTSLHNLARAYQDAGRKEEAIALYETVLEGRRRKLEAGHPNTLITLADLARAYQVTGKPEQALSLLQQAAAGIEKRKSPDPVAGRIIGDLIACHEHLKQYDRAEGWRRKWLAVVKEGAGPQSAAYAAALAGLGRNLLQQQKHAEAEQMLRDSLTILAKNQPDDWLTFDTQSLLGAALLRQEKYADAERLLKGSYAGMKKREAKIPPQARVHLSEALERLVQLYDAWDKPDRAVEWRRKLEAAKKPAD